MTAGPDRRVPISSSLDDPGPFAQKLAGVALGLEGLREESLRVDRSGDLHSILSGAIRAVERALDVADSRGL